MARATRAVDIIYELSGGVPLMIKQSHLDKKQGRHLVCEPDRSMSVLTQMKLG